VFQAGYGPAARPHKFSSKAGCGLRLCSPDLDVFMGVGRGLGGGPWSPWILKFSAKQVFFFVSTGKNLISQLLAPHWQNLGKIP